jgi:hypothetical protein
VKYFCFIISPAAIRLFCWDALSDDHMPSRRFWTQDPVPDTTPISDAITYVTVGKRKVVRPCFVIAQSACRSETMARRRVRKMAPCISQ